MADAKVAPSKLAMSRALGAAFLNHQVEQLEKSVHTGGNWRERRTPQDNWRGAETKKSTGPKVIKKRSDEGVDERRRAQETQREQRERRSEDGKGQKDADIVVLDASVLVHGLYHLKRWSREGREEVVIIPLEGEDWFTLVAPCSLTCSTCSPEHPRSPQKGH